jgi:selenide,water dikinase
MRADTPLTRDLVLVGGGHAHALVLRRWGMAPLAGARLTLIDPGPTAPYSGMLPGHVAGYYPRAALDIDLVRLARFAGARLITGRATGIDPVARRIRVGAREVAYDVASLDIGITSDMPTLPGFADHAVPAKPLGPFALAWRRHLDRVRAGQADGTAAVIGGGVAGLELALAMAHALRGAGARPQVAVIDRAAAPTGLSPGARRAVEAAMAELGVRFVGGAAPVAVEDAGVRLAEARIPAAFTAGAAGARAQDWPAEGGLPVADGFVRVGPTLQVEGHPDLFAVGDCAHLVHAPRPKAGVYAVRAAPVLHRNLRAALAGGAMRPYRPQARYLKLISLGGRRAVAERGGRALSGPLAGGLWAVKDRIDRRFMARLRDLPAMAPPPPPRRRAAGHEELALPLCGGCGAKLAAPVLGRAMAQLPPPDAAILSGPGDDAAVIDLGGGRRQVLTADHLRALTEDPARLARIAAVHALGDVWAMGARPQAALASVVLPRMSQALQARTLEEVTRAASEVLRAAGADLVGGHSTMGAETTLGFTVTGLCDGEPIGLGGARPGDALILTRPLGSGVILAAEMAGAAPGAQVIGMLDAMERPQGDAAALLARHAGAMTDVTGFGLAGHAGAIARASGVAVVVAPDAVPAYPGARELAAAGHASSLHAANVAATPVAGLGAGGPAAALLHDPQTAGGLLAAVPASQADALIAALRGMGHRAARIGHVRAGAGVALEPPAPR